MQYGDELLRTAYLLVRDQQTAEEAVMDTFAQAYSKIQQLKEPAKLRSWLLRMVVNRCRMKMRTWSWRNILPSAHVDQMVEATEQSPEELMLAEWRHECLSDAILKLDYIYREAITLFYYNGLNVAEISEQIKCNENTVKARLSRGRAKLKQMLGEGDGDETGARAY
ncbi:RNA polymerase subunit sigma-24 [Cohnella abietis]|uniref:RNA polymerase subunit sigma-24 n=2 Tax=Cohnella abietis TaxID=2507935 RepID=A0A3T1D0M3_9BACL|nr:RNA polymerase subunit sigma-24 [Cohnella abietis]